jgi:hypothetical protein
MATFTKDLPAIITITPWTFYQDLPAIITVTAAGFFVEWDSPDDANLYVEVFGAVRLRGQADSKNTWHLLGTVVSTIGRFTHDPDLPAGYYYIVKLRVIDKAGRVSPFSHVLEVITE